MGPTEQLPPGPPGYPPAPWPLAGQMWIALFRLAAPPALPPGLAPLLPRHLLIAAIRYREGALCYDEFVTASLARRGHLIGTHIQQIWVDSPASQQGGRDIWGLDKQLADFQWSDDQVRITNDRGLTVTLRARSRNGVRMPLLLPLASFGTLRSRPTYALARVRARSRPAVAEVLHWPEPFPTLLHRSTTLALAAPRFRITVPAPRPIGPPTPPQR